MLGSCTGPCRCPSRAGRCKCSWRARDRAGRVDQLLAQLKDAGVLKDFNRGYKAYRLSLAANGQTAPSYQIVAGGLRMSVITALVKHGDKVGIGQLAQVVRTALPWA